MTHDQASMKGVDGRVAWATLAFVGSAWALLAQTPTFRSTIDIVQVDVSVLDKNRSPVRDLKAADFTILVDDRPQPVAVFAAIDIPDPAPAPLVNGQPVTWMHDVAPDVQTNQIVADPRGRLIVLLLDDAMMPLDPKVVQRAKEAARRVIDKIGPDDQMAVVFTAGSGGAQNFTGDRGRLIAAVDSLHAGWATYFYGWDVADTSGCLPPGPPAAGRSRGRALGSTSCQPGRDYDAGFRIGAVRTLEEVADALIAAPERRKALVYISPGVPVNPALADEAQKALVTELPGMYRRMQAANISIYAIDPTGTDGIATNIQHALSEWVHSGAPVDQLTGQPPRGQQPLPGDYAHFQARLHLNFLEETASNTGGRATVGTDNVLPGIDQMFRETASYYLLGYRTPEGTKPGSIHRLSVKVARPDVEIRTRNLVYAPEAEPATRGLKVSPMTKAIASPLPNADLPLDVVVGAVPQPNSRQLSTLVVMGITWPTVTEARSDAMDVELRVFTPDGRAVTSKRESVTVALGAARAGDTTRRSEALSRFDLAPGRYQIRIGAQRKSDGVAGSVFADVEVPNATKAALTMFDVFLGRVSAEGTGPSKTVGATDAALAPTTQRTFDRTDKVDALVTLAEGGSAALRPATLRIAVTDSLGRDVSVQDVPARAEDFQSSSRSWGRRVHLPLEVLSAGEYLVTFSATSGADKAERRVRVVVRGGR